jgi:hypothetical protein
VLGSGPRPLEQLKAALSGDTIEWDESAQMLKIRFVVQPGREAEDVIGSALHALLAAGARISAVSRGQSLERAFLDIPKNADQNQIPAPPKLN